MRLELASRKAVKYACINFHYAKSVPAASLSFSVFEGEKWCGVICYGLGASAKMCESIGLKQGQFAELVRVALNGKQSQTSKAVALSIRLLKKKAPMVRALVSYADKGQGHNGIIYQATNWQLVQNIASSGTEYFYENKWRHDRGRYNWKQNFKSLPKRKKAGKWKYMYFYDRNLSMNYPRLQYPAREA